MVKNPQVKDIPIKKRRSEYDHLWVGDKTHHFGKRVKWDKERLDELAEKMFKYIISHKDVLFVRRFFTAEKVRMTTMYDVMHRSELFEETFRLCQQICADRVHHGVLTKKLEGNYAAKFMHFFDSEVSAKDLKHKKKELAQKLEVTKESDIAPEGYKIILEVAKE